MRRSTAAICLAATLALAATPARAAKLFADDVAVDLAGNYRISFEHILEPDGDPDSRPGTINRAPMSLSLNPTLLINEFVSVETLFEVEGVAGQADGLGAPGAGQ